MATNANRRELLYSIHIIFRLCKAVPDLSRVKCLTRFLKEEGFHPASAIGNETLVINPEIDTLVETHFNELLTELAEYTGLLRSTGFPIIIDGFCASKTNCAFQWAVFKGGYIKVTLNGSVWAFPEARKIYQEPLAERMFSLAVKLYSLAQPVYGFIADPDVDNYSGGDNHAVKQKIETLNWINFFGPEYVSKYGQNTLINIPGHSIQSLPDGGLLYQSRPSIVVENEIAHKRWQREAAAYLASHGIPLKFGKI